MLAILLLCRAHVSLPIVGRALLLSLLAVAFFGFAIGAVGLWFDSEYLQPLEYVSVNECLLQDKQQALSLFWSLSSREAVQPRQIGMHRLDSGRPGVQIYWPEIHPYCLAASSNGDRIVLGAGDGAIYSARITEPETAPDLLGKHSNQLVRILEIAPDDSLVVSIDMLDICAWNLDEGTLRWSRRGIEASSICIATDSRSIVCGLQDGEVLELDAESGRTIRKIARLPQEVVAVRISPDGCRLACLGAGRQIEVLSWPTATPLWRHIDRRGYAAYCHIACFSPCGRFLIVPTDEDACNLAIWSVQTGRRLGELRGHTRIALGARFAPDGRLVSWGTDGTVRTWDVERQRALRVVSLAAAEHSS